ncbi:methylated-DNA--[protein]-cysteine S-methyltransferase [Guyparkeria hydrothermalis]|uniref:methylated-DNA--[protein]-cysteine S-methyltransferase n=1 Tax=Guyparkeria hydrothermalis TaxID=923 RepID=UPI0020217BE1|nr:methylated-DNA--[protein]-cysteine S-methyltransferase [Guyparkeria hydrothermalis]MCL7743934.1 methylated-DNA--[protein]-cysteine S-methyltransferase [Guyparkeria hydrothermalis]
MPSSTPREACLPLGHSRLTAHLEAGSAGIERMWVGPETAPCKPPADEPAWADVIAALTHWPERLSAGADWTRHPAFPEVGTPFQRAVWSALCAIPPGKTVGYGELARRIGRPRAARAIGQAVGANPWAPLVPCHRVLAGDGSLGGYAGGTAVKSALLALEGIAARRD